MSEAHDNHHGGHQAHAEVETDRLKAGFVGLAILAICVLIVLLVAFADQYFTHRLGAELQDKVLGKESAQLKELRASEERKLTRYQWADQKNGVVRIPVERAADLVIDEYARPLPPPPAPAAVDGGTAPDPAAPAAPTKEGAATDAPAKEAKEGAAKEAPAKDAHERSPAPPSKVEDAPAHGGGGEGAAK